MITLLRRLHLIVGYYVAGVTFVLGTALCTVIALLCLPWIGRSAFRRRFRYYLHRFLRSWFVFLRVLRVALVDFSPMDRYGPVRGRVLVAPHVSLLDALLVFAAVPDTVCVFKRELVRHPAFGPLARACGHLGNGSGAELFRSARKELEEGTNVLFFPEGTRRRTPTCGPLHGGFAVAARRSHAPIMVVHLTLPPGVLTKNNPLWCAPAGGAPALLWVEPGRSWLPDELPDDLDAAVRAELEPRAKTPR